MRAGEGGLTSCPWFARCTAGARDCSPGRDLRAPRPPRGPPPLQDAARTPPPPAGPTPGPHPASRGTVQRLKILWSGLGGTHFTWKRSHWSMRWGREGARRLKSSLCYRPFSRSPRPEDPAERSAGHCAHCGPRAEKGPPSGNFCSRSFAAS